MDLPLIGSVYLLSPRAAKAMNRGMVPGAVVPDELLQTVLQEWKDPREGLTRAVERAARLAAVLKGLGYRGVQFGGIHRSFETVARILDRLEEIQDDWREYVEEFRFRPAGGFYAFPSPLQEQESPPNYCRGDRPLSWVDRALYGSMEALHRWLFNLQSPLAPYLEKRFPGAGPSLLRPVTRQLDGRGAEEVLAGLPHVRRLRHSARGIPVP